jgi:threonine dehydratase
MTEIPPFNHEWTISGQGTLALEILDQVSEFDACVVSVGGCGLISGVITALKSSLPQVHVFGAEPSALDDTYASLKAGYRRGPTDPNATSICDALRVSPPGELCWDILVSGCDEVITVSDTQTIKALKVIMRDLKQIVEPSGAVALAAVLSETFISRLKSNPQITRIVVVLCGSNVAIDAIKQYI